MNPNKDNQMVITDDQGNEHLMTVLFTYEHEERQKKYVFFFDEADPDNVIAMIYNDEGELFDIEDDDEYAEIEEVFNAYNEDPKIQEIK